MRTLAQVFRCKKIGGVFELSRVHVDATREVLAAGGLVVYPTETVYGLGADAFNEAAVGKVFRVKRRESQMRVSMAVMSIGSLSRYGLFDASAREFCMKHMPGPVTVLLKATPSAPHSLISAEDLIGLRIPDHPVALQLLKAFGPITATSANRHGGPAPVACEDAAEQLGGDVDIYIDAGPCAFGKESTVVDLSGGGTRVIRKGAIPEEEL